MQPAPYAAPNTSQFRNGWLTTSAALSTEEAQASLVWQIDDLARSAGLEWNVPPLQGCGLKQYEELERNEHVGGAR